MDPDSESFTMLFKGITCRTLFMFQKRKKTNSNQCFRTGFGSGLFFDPDPVEFVDQDADPRDKNPDRESISLSGFR